MISSFLLRVVTKVAVWVLHDPISLRGSTGLGGCITVRLGTDGIQIRECVYLPAEKAVKKDNPLKWFVLNLRRNPE